MNQYIINLTFIFVLAGRLFIIFGLFFIAADFLFYAGELKFGIPITDYVFWVPIVTMLILALTQKCPSCNKRILLLPMKGRNNQIQRPHGFYQQWFGELLGIMKRRKIPCHHCGEYHEY